MGKIVLLSLLIATVAIPTWAARVSAPRPALRRALWAFALFCLAYGFAVVVVYHRL